MERMKWIEDLDVRGVCTQGIVLDGGFTRTFTASFQQAVSRGIIRAGSTRSPASSCRSGC
jgi:hypothetical protein